MLHRRNGSSGSFITCNGHFAGFSYLLRSSFPSVFVVLFFKQWSLNMRSTLRTAFEVTVWHCYLQPRCCTVSSELAHLSSPSDDMNVIFTMKRPQPLYLKLQIPTHLLQTARHYTWLLSFLRTHHYVPRYVHHSFILLIICLPLLYYKLHQEFLLAFSESLVPTNTLGTEWSFDRQLLSQRTDTQQPAFQMFKKI